MDHATGLEKRELQAIANGNCDPWHMQVLKRGPGTKDKPTMIPCSDDARVVGCLCE